MSYYYRPNNKGVSKVRRPTPYAPRHTPRTPRALPKVQWRLVGIGFGILVLATLGWFGITKFQNWSSRRSAEADAARVAAGNERRAALEKSIAEQATTPIAAALLWEQKMKDGATEEAVVAAEVALKLQPNWRDGFLMLGSAQLSAKDYTKAQTALDRALDLDPIYPPTHQLFATLYSATGQKVAASQETEKAISLSEKTGIQIGG